jgi:radical SAM superfamily enzyme YgiQ (UPF0313 family)
MSPLRVYLCDLTHDSIILVSDTIPINVGFIGAYAKKLFGDDVEVSLFKYPLSAIKAIKQAPPDVIGLSDYSWNSNLSEYVASVAKACNPDVLTVMGGTNFPHDPEQQRQVMARRHDTDIHTVFEGETAFAKIIARTLDARDGGGAVLDAPIDGSVFIAPETRGGNAPELVRGAQPARIRNLDDIPSPYLNGMLDKFFDGRLTPFIETNRGCPFKCSFCHTGADYFQKINNFSTERIRAEIAYIGPKMAERGIVNLHIADTNFGMFPRDRDICEALYEAQQEYGWPLQVMATTGKNNKERVIEITGRLGTMFSVNMSVQSMDATVLDNIKRANIKLDHYVAVNQHLRESGRATKAELIIGLPGETRESFIRGVEQVIEAGVSSTTIYTLMLLHGTEFKSPEYREKFGIKGKFRIVPLNFGEYDGAKVFDYEEVCTENKDMSFDDYVYLRGFALLVEALLNGRPFEEFFLYAGTLGVSRTRFLERLYDNLTDAPDAVRAVMADFLEETRSELWESEEALVAHYQEPENYDRLVRGEVGGNLIYKYKSKSVAFTTAEWIDFLADQTRQLASERHDAGPVLDRVLHEIDSLERFCRNKVAGLLDASANLDDIEEAFDYDIANWLRANGETPLAGFACKSPIRYRFHYTEDQLVTREDQFKRYGTDVNALSKIVTRISNLESLFRKVATADGETVEYIDADNDQFVRYALSH